MPTPGTSVAGSRVQSQHQPLQGQSHQGSCWSHRESQVSEGVGNSGLRGSPDSMAPDSSPGAWSDLGFLKFFPREGAFVHSLPGPNSSPPPLANLRLEPLPDRTARLQAGTGKWVQRLCFCPWKEVQIRAPGGPRNSRDWQKVCASHRCGAVGLGLGEPC